MIAVILAAGMAKRLRPLTSNTPKCLLDVKGRSLLERSMDALKGAGISEFVIVTGYLNHMIENFVKEHYGDSIRTTFIHNALYDGEGLDSLFARHCRSITTNHSKPQRNVTTVSNHRNLIYIGVFSSL